MRLQAQNNAIYVKLVMPGTNQIAGINNDFRIGIFKLKKEYFCCMQQAVNLLILSHLILLADRTILFSEFFHLLCTGSLAMLKQN